MVVVMPGEVPQVTAGARVAASMWSSRSNFAPGSEGRVRQWATASSQCGARAGREAAALEVGEGGLVGGDEAGAGSGFDAHVADGHAAFHGEGADGGAGVFDDVAGGAVGADAADDVEDDVLGGDAEGEFAVDGDAEGLGLRLRQGLRGQDVLDFAGADAEGESAEGPVGGGVRVAADDGAAGLGGAEFGSDHVDDALVGDPARRRTRCRTRRSSCAGRRPGRSRIWSVMTRRSCTEVVGTLWSTVAMVRSGRRTLRPATRRPSKACGRGDLVDEVEVDVEDAGLACGLGDEVVTARLFRRGCGGVGVVIGGSQFSVLSCQFVA